jgi:hypothetical protein
VHRAPAIERDGSGPQRVVRRGHQHLVAIAEQRAQRLVDQLGGAIADEDGFGIAAAHAAVLLLQQDGLARGIHALLVRIALCLRQVLHQRQAQDLRRAEAIGARVADVQRDDLVALPFQLQRAARERAADLVAHMLERLAGLDAGIVFHRGSLAL